MTNELHLSAPHAGMLITAKFGFVNEAGEGCLRLMVVDTAAGKTLETLVPVAHVLHATNWFHGRLAELEAEYAAANPQPAEPVVEAAEPAKADAVQEFAEKVAEDIIKEVQQYDASKKKKAKK